MREEVRVFRQTTARLRYIERKEREANMAVGGIPIQLSTGPLDDLIEKTKGPLADFVLPVPNHTKKTLQLDGKSLFPMIQCLELNAKKTKSN